MDSSRIINDRHCFCCGDKNDRGLKLKFTYPGEGKAETLLTVPEYFTGWENLTHGGLISMLLDETMAHACIGSGLNGVTAELTVRFRKPLPVETEIIVTGEMSSKKGRIVLTTGKITDKDENVYATGKARFIGETR